MSSRTVIRPRLSVIVYAVVALASVAAFVSLLVSGAGREAAAVVPIPAVLLGLGWVTLVTPCVVFDDDAIEVRNPLRTIRVPYGRVRESRTQYGFALVTDDGVVQAWAAPRPDIRSAMRLEPDPRIGRDPRVARDARDSLSRAAVPGSPSGDALVNLADRVSRHEDTGEPVTRRWNAANLVVLTVAIAVAIGAVLVNAI